MVSTAVMEGGGGEGKRAMVKMEEEDVLRG